MRGCKRRDCAVPGFGSGAGTEARSAHRAAFYAPGVELRRLSLRGLPEAGGRRRAVPGSRCRVEERFLNQLIGLLAGRIQQLQIFDLLEADRWATGAAASGVLSL